MIHTLYLDMDGVIADFDFMWSRIGEGMPDQQRFMYSVLEQRIFEKLPLMPNAEKLLKFLRKLQETRVEILSSTGNKDPRMFNMAAAQKLNWLEANKIYFKANFVSSASQKCDFAMINTLLVDDRTEAIEPFKVFGGVGILHTDIDETIEKLGKYVS